MFCLNICLKFKKSTKNTAFMSQVCKVLLTGASGTIGRELLRRIAGRPDLEVHVFDKQSIDNRLFYRRYQKNIHLYYGDLSNESSVNRLPGGFDVVIHLAAILAPKGDHKPTLVHKINITGTKILINHLESTSPNAFFMYSSCISVYGDRLINPMIRINDPVNPSPNDQYAQSKLKAEAIVQASELDWTIFRITAILKRHKLSRLMFHIPLDTKIETCSPGNAAQAFCNAIDMQHVLCHRLFNVGGGEKCRITYREFLNRVFQMAGLGMPYFPPRAFATRNYHCGFFEDSDVLDNILHFRSDDLNACMEEIQSRFKPATRFVLRFLKHTIHANLLRRSSPYRAYITANRRLVEYYFGEEM